MKTSFARWLAEHGDRDYAFAGRHALHRDSVCWLAGRQIYRNRRVEGVRERRVSTATFQRISEITGIRVGLLIEDAMQAQQEEVNGKTTT